MKLENDKEWYTNHDEVVRMAKVLRSAGVLQDVPKTISYFENPYHYCTEYKMHKLLGKPRQAPREEDEGKVWSVYVEILRRQFTSQDKMKGRKTKVSRWQQKIQEALTEVESEEWKEKLRRTRDYIHQNYGRIIMRSKTKEEMESVL